MEKDSTSFWADIKKYEDILAKDPKSYCFAPLSELYRKLGLLDDAVGVAKQGTDLHPEYIGGFMALGRALFEKGAREDAKISLEKVALATPENLLAQKILSQIYQEEGNLTAAEKALQLLVTFNPEDTESTLALEVLQRSISSLKERNPVLATDASLVDNDEGYPFSEEVFSGDPNHLSASALADESSACAYPENSDIEQFLDSADAGEGDLQEDGAPALPLPTVTLAELYEAQGLFDRAQEVYSDLLQKDPDNHLLQDRLSLLSLRLESAPVLSSAAGLGEPSELLASGQYQEDFAPDLPGDDLGSPFSKDLDPKEAVLALLEQWLDSVRRRKACR